MSNDHEDPLRLSYAECAAAFAELFPPQWWTTGALSELAPSGWSESPLRLAFHPTLEQVYEEAVHAHRNIRSLLKSGQPARPEPTFAEIQAEYRETPLEPAREIRELLGRCVWDVFSDNHEVVAPDGRIFDLGSFRAAGGFIAEELNRMQNQSHYDYIDFFLGTIWLASRVDLTPVYTVIFRRLKERGFDWVYHFPRLMLVDMRPLRDALQQQSEPEWINYSPEESLARQQADEKHDAELAEMRESLDQGYREAVQQARHLPPPWIVLAYRTVYGHDPRGWPPQIDEPS
jgi:hypothetical protein